MLGTLCRLYQYKFELQIFPTFLYTKGFSKGMAGLKTITE